MTPETRDLVERTVGIATTFVLFRTASRMVLGIPSPGTAAAVLATIGAAACASGTNNHAACTVQGVVNKPGQLVGRYLVQGGEHAVGMITSKAGG